MGAGILNHMVTLCIFGMANYDSYSCAASHCAGAWIGFGADHRNFPDMMPEESRIEYEIDKKMPISLKEALGCMKKDTASKIRMGGSASGAMGRGGFASWSRYI